jgi:ABC-type glycerol-3-phosphate transport system permease component
MNSEIVTQGIIWGSVLAIANGGFALLASRFAFKRSNDHDFLSIIFGSMLVRIVLTLSALWFGLAAWHLHKAAFPITLLTGYVVFMAVEILSVHRRYSRSRPH